MMTINTNLLPLIYRLGSHGEVDQPKEDARTVHAKFECEARTDWWAYDPLLIAEGCFALATVLTFLGKEKQKVNVISCVRVRNGFRELI